MLESSFNEMGTALEATRGERDALLAGLEQQVRERTAALERAQERLIQTEKLSSLGRLSASIAHEINNPLAGILTTAKLLIRTIGDAPTTRRRTWMVRQLGLVQRETERCTAIVRNLLGFARERPLTLTDADVNVALDEALFLVQNQFALQNITLERDLAPVPPVRADFGQLRQAFANIVINACDAMPQGGPLRVRTRALQPEQVVEVVIARHGHRHPARAAVEGARPVLHDQGEGHRPRAVGRLRRRRAPRREAVDRQPARRGHSGDHSAAAGFASAVPGAAPAADMRMEPCDPVRASGTPRSHSGGSAKGARTRRCSRPSGCTSPRSSPRR